MNLQILWAGYASFVCSSRDRTLDFTRFCYSGL